MLAVPLSEIICLANDKADSPVFNTEIFYLDGAYSHGFSSDASATSANFSNIQGLTGALGGVGNIDANPQFLDLDGEDDTLGTADDDVRRAEDLERRPVPGGNVHDRAVGVRAVGQLDVETGSGG